ncbi:hypothetical protein QYM36_005481 [Artemia franciscana]|uniref:Endonuclease/exonuclease/phosphatase domain-containing protein n=1 Tax=Artemia franciscana TaxID=6661 RepID=A0AA88HW30_ARTSF|nr:hypothetical protein QYM36_005481 [Artemia franciscana]
MSGHITGLVDHVKKVATEYKFTHCVLHRQALVAKNLLDEVKDVLDQSVKIANFGKTRPQKSRYFKMLCHEMGSVHENLLLHIEVRLLLRTMVQLSKTEQVVNEMDNYGLDILALSEVRWTGAGSQTLKKGSTILHSGTEKKKEAGVAIMLSKSASRALTKWTPINERIIVARFTGRQAKLTVVACYAPTNEADDTTKDNFYNTLQAVAKDIPSHDLVCFVGDFNAKVGSDKSYCPEVLGSQGLGEINENGILLVDFALTNDLIIGGTHFEESAVFLGEASPF